MPEDSATAERGSLRVCRRTDGVFIIIDKTTDREIGQIENRPNDPTYPWIPRIHPDVSPDGSYKCMWPEAAVTWIVARVEADLLRGTLMERVILGMMLELEAERSAEKETADA